MLAVCQLAPRLGAVRENVSRAVRAVHRAADAGARLVVLPELVTSGYVFADREELAAWAEPADGPAVAALAAVAADRDVVLVAGFAEQDGEGRLFNSAVLADVSGVRAVYRKVHLWDAERELFLAGDEPPPVVETALGRVAVMVCYDLEFPEWTRLAALGGADIVCAPTNWPAQPSPDDRGPIELVHVRAAAAANRMFVAVADRVGEERGVRWVGGSTVVGPDGHQLVQAAAGGTEQLLLADCDLVAARDKQLNTRNDVLRDRRPQLYGGLLYRGLLGADAPG